MAVIHGPCCARLHDRVRRDAPFRGERLDLMTGVRAIDLAADIDTPHTVQCFADGGRCQLT